MFKTKMAAACVLLAVLFALTACSGSPAPGITSPTQPSATPASTTAAATADTTATAAPAATTLANIPDADNVNNVGYPVVKSKVTLTLAVPVSQAVTDIKTNNLTQWIEQNSGVGLEITPLSPSAADLTTQINLMFTSGDLPDMLWPDYGITYAMMAEYANAGYLSPLDDLIAAYGVNYQRVMDLFPKDNNINNAAAYVTYNGHVYAMPTTCVLLTDTYGGNALRYQSQFTQKLGIKEPTTLDEFYNMLVAFKSQDPNGNGKADEVPLTGFKGMGDLCITMAVGNAFQYTDSKSYLKVNDGKVSFVANNDSFKQTVEYLKKLVDEGLMDPAIFTQDAPTEMALNIQTPPRVGVCADGYGSTGGMTYDNKSEAYQGLELLPALAGPDGYKATAILTPSVVRGMVLTTKCKTPGAAFRVMDMMLSNEGSLRARLGAEGSEWQKAAEGELGRDGQQALYHLLKPQEWIQPTTNVIWDDESFVYSDAMNHVVDDRPVYNRMAKKCTDYMMKTVTGEQLPELIMGKDDSAAYADLQKLIVDFVNQNVSQFALGDEPMSNWDSYVAQLKDMGVDNYVSLAQAAYDAMNK